jgi:hypothetical protein
VTPASSGELRQLLEHPGLSTILRACIERVLAQREREV